MALATSPAAAISRLTRRGRAIAIFATLSLAAPALAGEQVYIWRDQSGSVRFSPVPEAAPSGDAEATVVHDGGTQPPAGGDTAPHEREAY